MSSLKLFGDKTLYEILEIPFNAEIIDGKKWKVIQSWLLNYLLVYIINFTVKKSYYKLALIHHPDRVSADEKQRATNDFNIIHQAYSILSNPEKKQAYDNGFDVFLTKATVSALWESHLKTVEDTDIVRARNNYRESGREKADIITEFTRGNGSLTHMLNHIPFMRLEDEDRIIFQIKELMKNGSLPNLKIKKIPKK